MPASIEAGLRVRLADDADVLRIAELIESSVRGLQVDDYSLEQREAALGNAFGVDRQLIADGTYFVVESESGELIACGGWSKRKTLFGSDHAAHRHDGLLDPAMEPAKIRALFVHPDWARRGAGSLILKTSERAAAEAGFLSFELAATLTGARLFSARGYCELERIDVPLAAGVTLPVIRMRKTV